MITLVKFIRNKLENAPPNNQIITKTLGKTGVLSWEHVESPEQIPEAEEFWYVRVVKEVGGGTPRGVFLLEPIHRVESSEDGEHPQIIHMIPGTYITKKVDNAILLHPKICYYPEKLGPNWVCSLSMKRKLMHKYRDGATYNINSIIVVFDGSNDWPREELPIKKSEETKKPEANIERDGDRMVST